MAGEEQGKKSLGKRAFLLLAVVAAGLAFYFFFLQAPPEASKIFRVTVLGADGGKVSGAVVQVLDGGEVVAEAVTVDGVVEFEDLPEKPLAFKVTTPAGETKTQLVDASKRKSLKADFSVEATVEPGVEEVPSVSLKVVDAGTNKGIAGAKIVYSIGKTSRVVSCGADGTANFLAPAGIAVRLRASAPGYYTQTLTVITRESGVVVALKRKPESASVSFSEEEKKEIAVAGKLFLLVEDAESGAPVSNGTACAFAAETGEQLGCAEVLEGNAEITGLTVGAKVFFSVCGADGYYDFSSAENGGQPIEVSKLSTARARMQKLDQKLYDLEVKKYTVISTVDEQNKPVQASVALVPFPSIIAFPAKSSSGTLQLQLANSTTYYAIAFAPGRVPARSNEFAAGDSIQLVLKTATPENSARLSVVAADEDGIALSGAVVTVLSDGLLAALPAYTTTSYSEPTPSPTASPAEELPEGVEAVETPSPAPEAAVVPLKPAAEFVLPVNAEYEARAAYQKGSGSASTYLVGDSQLTVTLLVNTGFLEVTAKDLLTGDPVEASFTLYEGETIAGACSGSDCVLKARAFREGKIVASARGYASTTRPLTFDDVKPRESSSLTIYLLPEKALNATIVRFTGLSDEKGAAVEGGAVRKNASYFANFFVASASGERTGFYARVGNAAEAANDNAFIIDFAAPPGMDAEKGVVYRSSAACADLLGAPQAGGLKWIDLSFAGNGTANIAVPFAVKPSAAAGSQVVLNYRAYSFSSTAVGGRVYSRYPEDVELGTARNTSSKSECHAKTNTASFEVISVKPPEKPAEEKEPAAEFTAGDTIVFDPLKGLQSAAGINRYDLQIDSVFPADAMPVKLKSKNAACSILLSIQSDNPLTRNCYRYDNAKQVFSFQSHELNAECPVHVEGNKLFLNGAEFKGEEKTRLYFKTGGCDLQANLSIPVRVTVAEVEGINVLPEASALSDSEAAKPFYIVNNLQVGSRQITLEYLPLNASTPTTKKISFTSPGAKAIAWRGPGTLSFLEGNETINEVFYENPVKQLEKGLGAVGGQRVTTCTDFKCCASGWCTRKALKQMITAFNEKAKTIASKTAFRRGQGEPLASLAPNEKFVFAAVAQGIQGSGSLLQQQNVSLSSSAPKTDAANSKASQFCARDQPAIYEIVASGKDANSLSLTASVLPLYNNNYVEGCNATPSTQNFIPLCSFLYGSGNCINASNTSNILTTNQLANLSYKIQLCMYPALPIVSLPYCLPTCAASTAYTASQKTAICTSLCAPAIASGVGLPAGGACVATCLQKFNLLVASTAPTVMNKINVFTIEGEIPNYGEATERDAFGKLGNALADAFSFSSTADYKLFDNAAFFDFGAGTCNDITTDFQNQLINSGASAALAQVKQGLQPGQQASQVSPVAVASGLVDSWLPLLAVTCACSGPQAWQDFQVWPPQFGGAVLAGPAPYPQFFNKYTPTPLCGGISSTLPSLGSKPIGSGKPGSINVNVQGNKVVFRVDLGVDGNCNIIPPWKLDWWRSIATPTNAFSLFSYLLGTNRHDIALSLSTTSQAVAYEKTAMPAGEFKAEETTTNPNGTKETRYSSKEGKKIIQAVDSNGSVSYQALDENGAMIPFKVEQDDVKVEQETIQGITTKTFTYPNGNKIVYTTDANGKTTITYSSRDGASIVVTDENGKVLESKGTSVKKDDTFPPGGPDKKAGAPATEPVKGQTLNIKTPPQPSFPEPAATPNPSPSAASPATPAAQQPANFDESKLTRPDCDCTQLFGASSFPCYTDCLRQCCSALQGKCQPDLQNNGINTCFVAPASPPTSPASGTPTPTQPASFNPNAYTSGMSFPDECFECLQSKSVLDCEKISGCNGIIDKTCSSMNADACTVYDNYCALKEGKCRDKRLV
ncbi:MAG: hypothetical protein ACP5O3_03565 [Candidatus Micrarchaeia archaeon]